MSEPTLCSPSEKRVVELQDEIDRLKAKIAELQPKADAYPKLVQCLHYYAAYRKVRELLQELGELE